MAMTSRKKVFLVLGMTCLFVMFSIPGAGIYLYYHPEQIKPIIERSLSAYSGSACSIESLSYTFQPTSIEAKNILFKPLKQQENFSMQIRFVKADMAVKGPFGQRSLLLENIQIKGIDLDLFSGPFTLPTITRPEKGKSSFLSHLFRRFFSAFVFKNIRFQSGEIIDGRISSINGAETIRADSLRARAGAGKPLFLSFALEINRPSQKIQFSAPDVTIRTDAVFNLLEHQLNATLESRSMTLQSPDVGIRRMEVFSRFSYAWPDKKLFVENLQVSGDTIDLIADSAKMGLFPVSVSGAKTINLETGPATYDMDKGEIESARLTIKIGDLRFREKADPLLSPLDLRFDAKARFNLHSNMVNLEQFHLEFSDIINMEGDFLAMSGPKDSIRLKVAKSSILSEKGFYFLPAEVKQALKPLTIEGPISVQGDLLGRKEADKWIWECDFISRLKKNPFAFFHKEAQFKGLASAVIKARGRFPDVIISAEIQGDNNVLSTQALSLEPFKMDLFFSMQYPLVDIKDVAVHIPQAKIDLTSRNILMKDIRINIPEGRVNVEKKSIEISESGFDAFGLKNLLIEGCLKENKITLSVQGRETDFFRLADSNRLLPSGWDVKARDSIQIKVVEKERGIWGLQSTLSLEKLVFQSKDGSKMGDNISLDIDIDSVLNLNNSELTLAASLKAREGEALFDRYYLNLKTNPLITSGNGYYHIQKRYLQLSRLSFALTDILPLEIQGRFNQDPSTGHTDITVSMPPVSIKPIFEHFLKEPWKTEKPFLETLETAGTVSAKLRINGLDNSWQAAGRFGWQQGSLISKEKNIFLKGIYLDLPVWYRTAVSKVPVEPLKGRLAVQSVTVPLLLEQSLNRVLSVSPNRISVKSSTEIRTPGGELHIGPVDVEELFGPELTIHTSLSFDGITLQPFLSEVWPHPLAGSLSGKLDPVRYKGHAVTSHGEVAVNVFGGRVVFSRLGASGIFTPASVFKLDAQGENLLLSEMTTGTSFGKIEGILEGYIRDFEIAYGQPQKFNLLLETIKKKGMTQRISVKAIDNIAQIGGGQSPFMGLAGSFAALFKKFPYEKIGIRAGLENDLFTINGTIKEGGTEYLIKRGSFSGVNVVNRNPDNRAGFKDMVKRIKRISQKGGPIVK